MWGRWLMYFLSFLPYPHSLSHTHITHTHTYAHTHTHEYAHTHTHTHKYAHTHTHTHTQICVHTHSDTHTHTQKDKSREQLPHSNTTHPRWVPGNQRPAELTLWKEEILFTCPRITRPVVHRPDERHNGRKAGQRHKEHQAYSQEVGPNLTQNQHTHNVE